MAVLSLNRIQSWLKQVFVAETNAGAWLRLLLLFVLVSAGLITLSLSQFFTVHDVGSRVITSTRSVPDAQTVDEAHIQQVLGAFTQRTATFNEHLQNPIVISDPYRR